METPCSHNFLVPSHYPHKRDPHFLPDLLHPLPRPRPHPVLPLHHRRQLLFTGLRHLARGANLIHARARLAPPPACSRRWPRIPAELMRTRPTRRREGLV